MHQWQCRQSQFALSQIHPDFHFLLNLWTSPIKAIPERTEFGASPEPVPLFFYRNAGIFFAECLSQSLAHFVIEVEPFNVNLPATVPLISWLFDNLVPTISGSQPVSKNQLKLLILLW